MFRVIKLAIYLIAGYAIYEFVCGLTEERPSGIPQEGSTGPQRRPRSGSGASLGGYRVPVVDGTGAERTQAVGRGVVS